MSDGDLVPSALVDALHRALAVRVRKVAQRTVRQATRKFLSRDGRVMLDRGDATTGVLQPPSGGTGHAGGAEPPLGNPDEDGYHLASTADGVRSWVPDADSGLRVLDATGATDLADRSSLRFGAGVVAADGPTGALYLPPVIVDDGEVAILVPVVDELGDPVVDEGGNPVLAYGPLGLGFTPGDGLTLDGTVLSLDIPVVVAHGGTGATTAAGARANLGAVGKFAADIGDGSTEPIAVTHSLDTEDVVVQVREAATGEVVQPVITVTDADTVTIAFGAAAATDEYRVVVMG